MSDSVQPHRQQLTRLRRPWDSPGKNTGVGCHFLLQRLKMKSESEVTQSYPTLSDPIDCSPPGSSVHGIFQARVLEQGAITYLETNMKLKTKNKMTRPLNVFHNHLILQRSLKQQSVVEKEKSSKTWQLFTFYFFFQSYK